MYISEETAQLILDAIAWSNRDWMDVLNWTGTHNDVDTTRGDFIRFCKARGIEGVEKAVNINENR